MIILAKYLYSFSMFRQHGGDMPHGLQQFDLSIERSTSNAPEDTKLSNWHTGFHVFLV